MSEEAIWAWLQHPLPPKCCHGHVGVQGPATALASHPRGMPRPCRAATAFQAAWMLGPWLRAPRGLAACTQGHASVPRQAYHGLGYVPWPWLLHACPGLGCCMPMGCCLGLGRGIPMPWQRAHGGLPWPSLLHALALAACPWGLPLPWLLYALGLAACPWGCCMPWPWPWMHALALAAACPHIWSDFLKMRVFLENEDISPKEAGSGHPKGMPACTPRRISPYRPALQQNWLVPFSIFVSLNSFHDFRIKARLQELLQKRPIIPPRYIFFLIYKFPYLFAKTFFIQC